MILLRVKARSIWIREKEGGEICEVVLSFYITNLDVITTPTVDQNIPQIRSNSSRGRTETQW